MVCAEKSTPDSYVIEKKSGKNTYSEAKILSNTGVLKILQKKEVFYFFTIFSEGKQENVFDSIPSWGWFFFSKF